MLGTTQGGVVWNPIYYNKKNLSGSKRSFIQPPDSFLHRGRRPRCKNESGGCINDRLRPERVFFILLHASKQINKQINKQISQETHHKQENLTLNFAYTWQVLFTL